MAAFPSSRYRLHSLLRVQAACVLHRAARLYRRLFALSQLWGAQKEFKKVKEDEGGYLQASSGSLATAVTALVSIITTPDRNP